MSASDATESSVIESSVISEKIEDGSPSKQPKENEQIGPKNDDQSKEIKNGEIDVEKPEELKHNGNKVAEQPSEAKLNGGKSSAENSNPESAAGENPVPEGDAKKETKAEEKPVEVSEYEELFTKLNSGPADGHKSLLQKHLTRNMMNKLKVRKTAKGGTLADCIRSGCENLDSKIGLYATDSEAYKTFSELFDLVIKDYHKLPLKKNLSHPNTNFGDLEKLDLADLDPEGQYIVSTRIRVGRCLDTYGFPPTLSSDDRKAIESSAVEAFDTLEDELKGTYYPLKDMSPETKKQLVDDHFLFKEDSKFRKCIGGNADWPNNRGIFYTESKDFLVWVNEGDHLRVISMQKGGDFGAVYKRLVNGVKGLEGKLKFARDGRLGYLNSCPSNLGTSLRASVHIKIPLLSASDKFAETCEKFNLEARGIHGEHTESEGDTFDISNISRLGLTEIQAVTEVHNGVKELIRLEKELAWYPENVDDMFDHLTNSKTAKSSLKKHLTKEIFDSLKERKTSNNATLGDCIISGVLNLDSSAGVYTADQECYTEFAALFDPIIKDCHKLKPNEDITHPGVDFGDLENLEFGDLDPEGKLIVSTRIRVGRSHKDVAFPPVLKKEDRITVEQKSVESLNCLEGELKGTYHPLTGMTQEVQDQLRADHFLFADNDRFLKAAGGYKDWPEGRGIFFSEDKNFLVWVNEEDHLRIISMQKGGDLGAVYKRLITGIKSMEEKLTFARDDRLGYLTFCPTNLGTTLRASVHMKIPHLASRKDFKAIVEKNKLQARGIHGEHTDSEGGVYDLSNKRRLGLTEIEAVREMAAGVKELIRLETEAANKTRSCSLL